LIMLPRARIVPLDLHAGRLAAGVGCSQKPRR
jgi:hypothetical protein